MTMFHMNKERAPGCTANTFEGSSLFISVVQHPPGYLLSLLCLSNHLQMRWQVTPAATVTKKDMTISICSPPPVAGSRLDNRTIISYLRTKRNLSKYILLPKSVHLFFLLPSLHTKTRKFFYPHHLFFILILPKSKGGNII